MGKDDKIRLLPGGGNKNEMAEFARLVKSTMPETIEHLVLMAKLSKIKYDALIEEGFTPEQALELSKNPFNT